jgi:hypothetical protein
MNTEYSFKDFAHDVADYIDAEYDGADITINDDERMTIKNMLDAHYHFNDSVSNAANYVIRYLRESRAWMEDNVQ